MAAVKRITAAVVVVAMQAAARLAVQQMPLLPLLVGLPVLPLLLPELRVAKRGDRVLAKPKYTVIWQGPS